MGSVDFAGLHTVSIIYRTSLLKFHQLNPNPMCRLTLLLKHKEDIRRREGRVQF
jgi:hypothetical protein